MVYWWMGECFVPPLQRTDENIEEGKTAEEFGEEFFNKLLEKGFIEPVNKKRNLKVGSCRMHPFIRSAVITFAERAHFIDFDKMGSTTADFTSSCRACLAGEGLVNIQNLGKLHMLFNVNEAILEFKPEWFLRMRNINVLCLGRWQSLGTHHIEVEETDFLEGMKSMNYLRFFSIQGVSRVTELPESISQLSNLTILDLRACHNLEAIPKGIGALKSLTHLDMSECYLLDRMPKEISSLLELQVLKGFVVADFSDKNICTLDDLVKLPKLRKLNVYTGVRDFPTEAHLQALQLFPALSKLTIAWGGCALQNKPGDGDQKKETGASEQARPPPYGSLKRSDAIGHDVKLENIEKLDFQCFPDMFTPSWLTPLNLTGLKKLYFRGEKFSDLGQFQELDDRGGVVLPVKEKWNVEVLRLKYLSELEMDWRELHELFPDLICVEKVNCPKLTFFPCDQSGEWINKAKLKQKQEVASQIGSSSP